MDPAERIMSDPSDPRWGGLEWSNWHSLDETGSGQGLVPRGMGIYRVRIAGQPQLIYVGISKRLRMRIGNLRRGVGHSAASCVAAHRIQGHAVEISWALVTPSQMNVRHPDDQEEVKRELFGLETDLIAACRRLFGHSPACQFHGRPLE